MNPIRYWKAAIVADRSAVDEQGWRVAQRQRCGACAENGRGAGGKGGVSNAVLCHSDGGSEVGPVLRFSGSRMINLAPFPGSDSTSRLPPWLLVMII
jgi:hypothetical protein